MRVIEFLDRQAVHYEVSEHAPAFTAQQMAAAEHEPGKYVAKPVIVKADGKYLMCVLSACYKIDVAALKSQLGAKSVALAE
ncbi:MAG: aminoacyl-tRNA deacylase, partial [Planctomycetota bacterium]